MIFRFAIKKTHHCSSPNRNMVISIHFPGTEDGQRAPTNAHFGCGLGHGAQWAARRSVQGAPPASQLLGKYGDFTCETWRVQWVDKKGNISTGNHRFSHEIWDFRVIFPFNQSIEGFFALRWPMEIVSSNPAIEHTNQKSGDLSLPSLRRDCFQ